MQAVTIRQATAADRGALAQLAALDSKEVPSGRALLAYVDGELQAALDLETCAELADPFHHTRALVQLLRLRAAQVHARDEQGQSGGHGLGRQLAAATAGLRAL